MSHIITYLFIKQANYYGQRIVANDTPKHKIGKERQHKIQDRWTKWAFFLTYSMTKYNYYEWCNNYGYGINNRFKNEFLIKASVLEPIIYINYLESANNCTYEKRSGYGDEDVRIKGISRWRIDRMIAQNAFLKYYVNSTKDCRDDTKWKNLKK